jgi:hypothetical protein
LSLSPSAFVEDYGATSNPLPDRERQKASADAKEK